MSGLSSLAIADVQRYRQQAVSLLLYQTVLESPLCQAFLGLLDALCSEENDACLRAYGHWFRTIAQQQQTWGDHLVQQVLRNENPFSLQAQTQPVETLPPALLEAAQQDLARLQQLYQCSEAQLARWVQTVCQLPQLPTPWSLEPAPPAPPLSQADDWSAAIADLATYYRQHGTGLLGEYRALGWQDGHLVGIPNPDPIRLGQLAAYDSPRQTLIQNTEFLLAGYPALHVLLYGSRGSGKSSLVKALLNQYGDQGLRLIEVPKAALVHLPQIVDPLRYRPQKFIVFVDDLSFEEDDDAFKALKVVLEGSLTARPQNVVVYATSNRRHLVREFFADRPAPRDADDLQAWDTVQEKLSFSDRFGLTLTFEAADQPTYLKIVHHLAAQAELTLDPSDLEARALQWATRHNGRSGRSARQFIDFLRADLAATGV